MSLRSDLDELNIDTIARELMNRLSARARGLCDYCGRSPATPPCKFPDRHSATLPMPSVTITASRITYDHDGALRIILSESPPGDATSVTRPWLQYEREIIAYLFERIARWTADGRKPAQTYFTPGLEREVARMIESAIEPPPGDAMPPRPPPTTIPSNGVPRQDRARGKENG